MEAAALETPGCAAADDATIAVCNVSKWFYDAERNPLLVLDRVDLVVPPHDIVAVLGPSGCGKSTLLNIIAGVLQPDRGEVRFGGTPAASFNDWSTIGYMFQEDRLLPWRTAAANVAFSLEAGSMARAERHARALEALALVGLADFAAAFPYQLSGGMRARVALARSLVAEPRILLMDEPFSKLDAQTRSAMHQEVLRIHELKHMTLVFVTHDVEESVVLADQVVVMAPRPGRVRETVDIELPRPRDAIAPPVASTIQRLRSLI